MKSLKVFTTLFLCVILCLGFVSCSDDDGSASALVGIWECVDEDEYYTVEFKSNGVVVMSGEGYYDGEWEYWTERGTYIYEGGELVVEFDDEFIVFEVVSLTSNMLKLQDEYGDLYTYRRVE